MKAYCPILAVLLGALSFSSVARAEDPRKAQADAFFEEGVKLHNADREADALERFKKAYALYPAPNTLMAQARAEHLLGRPLEAIRHYREALKNPLLHPKNGDLARQYIAELEVRTARVSVTGPSGAKFSIFGETLRLPLDAPVDVEPGTFLVHADLDGKVLQGTILAVAGKLVVLELKPKDDSAAPRATTASPPTTEPPPIAPSTPSTRMIVSGAFLAGGLAALGLGVGFGVTSTASTSDAKGLRSATPGLCASPGGACDVYKSKADDADHQATLSTIGYIAAGALAATAVTLFVFWPSGSEGHEPSRSARLAPSLGPGFAGFSSQFAF